MTLESIINQNIRMGDENLNFIIKFYNKIRAPLTPPSPADKLAQTKLREREVRESHRAELHADKDTGTAARAAGDSLLRSERLEHDTFLSFFLSF